MKTTINPEGTSFIGFGSFTHELAPCRFCGAAAGEVEEMQIEADSWTGRIDCSNCDVSLSPQYTSPSPEEAIGEIVRLWNSTPT